jgi:hypothetical protein
MRKSLSLLICLLLVMGSQAQNKCQKVRKGNFKLAVPGRGITIVTRSSTKQIETNDSLGTKVSYDIIWQDNCNYKLRNRRLLSGTSKMEWKLDNVINVEILEVNDKTYKAHFTSNFSTFVTDYELEIIK